MGGSAKKRTASTRKIVLGRKKKRLIAIGIVVCLGLAWWSYFPAKLFVAPHSYVLYDKDGQLLGATIASDGQWRFPLRTTVPEKFKECITLFEDKRFFYHPGVDFIAIARAIKNNFSTNKSRQGGSTLSMQLMRLSNSGAQRNLWQKLKEAMQAVRLEATYSKKTILSLYASNAPFGGNVVGIDAAAWRYFGRSPELLSWSEMATLSVLPNAPSLIHPGKNRDELLNKRNRLLRRLADEKVIDEETFQLSIAESLPEKPYSLPNYAPHLLQRFKQEKSTEQASAGNTTIDIQLQQKVFDILMRQHRQLKANDIKNLCALVIDIPTGNVLVYVGNIASDNADDRSYVDIIRAPRSPGSTLKPILYAAALSDGQILPNMLLPDIPTQIAGYTPQNFDRMYDGAVPAAEALSRSLNIPYVKILQQYKYERFYELLKQLGITTLVQPADHYGLSMILGGSEISLWDLCAVYAGFARSVNRSNQAKGIVDAVDFFPPNYLKSSQRRNKKGRISLLDATSVWYALQAMQDVMRPGEEGLWQQFGSAKKIAWKTGTSFGFRDAWAIGVSSQFVVGVWAGNADGEGRPDLLGIKAAAPVMFDIFRELPTSPPFPKPVNNVVYEPLCRETGFRAGLHCEHRDTVMLPPQSVNSPLCPYHKTIHLNSVGNARVSDNCYPVSQMQSRSWFVLPPTMEFYYKPLHPQYRSLPPFLPNCADNDDRQLMELIYPTANSKIYIPVEMDGQKGRMICQASHKNDDAKIFWHLDDVYLGSTHRFHRMAIDAAPGFHVLRIVDEAGESVSRRFEILKPGK